MSDFPNAEAICRVKDPLNWTEEKKQLMQRACREMAIFHSRNSPDMAALYNKHGFDPRTIDSESALEKIPSLSVTAMKHFLFTSLPEAELALRLTSSGTRGQKTQIWFDGASLARVQAQLDGLWDQEGLRSELPTNYLNFIYDPDEARDLGISFSVKNEQRFTPVAESYFTVHKDAERKWQFQKDETIARLRRYAEDGKPVRLLGIPSFIFELIQVLGDESPILLPPGSYMLTGGGWKAAEDKSVTREAFRKLVTEKLGIRDENMRDSFGMAEHSAPYIECRLHRFHVPVYNRVFVRSPENLEVLPPGKVGLLEFLTPYNAMMPNLAILSTDLGYLATEPCGCGWESPVFFLVGRGGLTQHKGCAITAGEIVRRK